MKKNISKILYLGAIIIIANLFKHFFGFENAVIFLLAMIYYAMLNFKL